jgi:eukaryotic-like serine/threonine-protein kinase
MGVEAGKTYECDCYRGPALNIDDAWLSQQFPDLSSLSRLVQGGQKSVYTATHPTDGSVVLKIIHPSQDPERIRREVLAVQKATCPRVPKVLGTGTLQTNVGNVIWVREQRISGASLRSVVQQGPLGKLDLLRLATHVLEALADAEKVQIVHRDVKPENIIKDADGNFWLLDFGIARHLDLTSLTGSHSPFGVGTAGYAPPEQFRNRKRDIDARADLFALGVTLYECATGANPFRTGARDDLEVLRNVERMALPPLQLSFDPSGDISSLVAALAQKRPDHRPASVTEALHWVKEICKRNNVAFIT